MTGKGLTKVPVLVATLLFLSVHNTSAIDVERAKESPCFEIKNTIRPSDDWGKSSLYYTLMSKLDIYLTATELTKRDGKDIGEDELYYDGCIYFETYDNGTSITKGFNGLNFQFDLKSYDEKTGAMEFAPKKGEGDWSAKCYNTLTDNKTFVFTACCTSENQMTWGAVSIVKSLPKDTVKQIHDHALSLGFKKEFFTSLRYDTCGDL